jgi:hypothetical protein
LAPSYSWLLLGAPLPLACPIWDFCKLSSVEEWNLIELDELLELDFPELLEFDFELFPELLPLAELSDLRGSTTLSRSPWVNGPETNLKRHVGNSSHLSEAALIGCRIWGRCSRLGIECFA